jgi:hypothetical protein
MYYTLQSICGYNITIIRFDINRSKVFDILPVVIQYYLNYRVRSLLFCSDPTLTFRDDIKSSIMDIMSDNTPLTVFSKRVRELTPANDTPHFTNEITIQVAIKDGKTTEAYTDKLSKAMEYVNEHGNHPVLP